MVLSDNLAFEPGLGQGSIKFGKQDNTELASGSLSIVYVDWHVLFNDFTYMDYDWSISVLDDDYGYDCGYVGIEKSSSISFSSSSPLEVVGYRGGSEFNNGQTQTISYASFIQYQNNGVRIQYNASTGSGQSGSPLFDDATKKVAGVHAGVSGYPQSMAISNNYFNLMEYLRGGYVL